MLIDHLFLVFIIITMSAIMSTVARTPVDAVAALKFFNTVGKLKTLKRTGWVNNEVFEPESVADHMYRMSMLGFLITDPAVNKDRLIKVCLVHDLAESIVGDITPYDGVSKEEKKKLELDAMKEIVDGLGNQSIADELMGLWMEYEEGDSMEAEVARQLDKYEMIVQVRSTPSYCLRQSISHQNHPSTPDMTSTPMRMNTNDLHSFCQSPIILTYHPHSHS